MGDPTTREGAIFTTANGQAFTIAGPPSTFYGTLDSGGIDSVGRYEGVFGSNTLVSIMGGQHREKNAVRRRRRQQSADPRPDGQSERDDRAGSAASTTRSSPATSFGGNVTKYVGGHTIKAGGDCEGINATVDRFQGGAGQLIYVLPNTAIPRRHLLPPPLLRERSRQRASIATIPSTWSIALPLEATPKSRNTSLFAQDSWKVDVEPDDQRRHPLGAPERLQPRRRLGVLAEQRTGRRASASSGIRREQPARQGLRELRPLLREHPAGHQHPRVRRRGAGLQLQPSPDRVELPARSGVAPPLERCSAAPSRSIRI